MAPRQPPVTLLPIVAATLLLLAGCRDSTAPCDRETALFNEFHYNIDAKRAEGWQCDHFAYVNVQTSGNLPGGDTFVRVKEWQCSRCR